MELRRPVGLRIEAHRAKLGAGLAGLVLGLASGLALGLAFAPVRALAAGGTADELRELFRGARAQAMGNAYVALADDEQALFYNPAGMAGVTRQSIHYGYADIDFNQDILSAASLASAMNGSMGESLNSIMGQNVFGRAQIAPMFLMPNFGVGILIDQQVAFIAKNKALPNITYGYQTTNGVQAAYGLSILKKGRRDSAAQDLRLGIGGKILWRRGGYRELSLTQMLNLSMDELNAQIGDYGQGIGVDAGLQYQRKFGAVLTLSAGAAWTEIGDIEFAGTAAPQPGNLSMGLGAKAQLPRMTATLAYDYRHANADTDPAKRHHLGLELKVPMLAIYGGLSQGNLSYGLSFDAWLFKVTAVSYAEVLGAISGQDTQRRYLVHLGLSF